MKIRRIVVLSSILLLSLGIYAANKNHPISESFQPKISRYSEPVINEDGLDNAIRSTVAIRAVNEFGGVSGAGVLLSDDGYILTCAHLFVIPKDITSKDVTVHLYEDPIDYKIKIIGIASDLDLALIKITNLPHHKLHFVKLVNPILIHPGMDIYVIGNPLGADWSVSKGVVSSIHRIMGSTDWLQYAAPSTFGNSGGPVVDANGNLVGIVSRMIINPSDSLKFAVSNEHIIEFINKLFQ